MVDTGKTALTVMMPDGSLLFDGDIVHRANLLAGSAAVAGWIDVKILIEGISLHGSIYDTSHQFVDEETMRNFLLLLVYLL